MTPSATKSHRSRKAGCSYFGLAVRGPEHSRTQTACEDAWRGKQLIDGGAIVVVADGMGSRAEAVKGSRKAVSATSKAFRNWNRHPGVEVEWMLRWLESQWRMEIAPSMPGDCATTCLYAGWSPQAGLVIGGLGDGMILWCERGKAVRKIMGRDNEAALNETTGLGCVHRLGDWVTVRITPRPHWAVILMTDGVADDLRPERHDEFSRWLVDDIAARDPATRKAMLREALVNWPTPGHSDDKTIAVLFST